MPTDETTLEALAERFSEDVAKHVAHANDFRAMDNAALHVWATRHEELAAESRLIADALRFRLAALTAPAAQTGKPPEYFDVVDKDGNVVHDADPFPVSRFGERHLRTIREARDAAFTDDAPHRIRLFAEVAASLPRGGAE